MPDTPVNSVITLIVKRGDPDLQPARACVLANLEKAGIKVSVETCLSEDEALDIFIDAPATDTLARQVLHGLSDHPVDFALQRCADRKKRLLIADMDSTMIAAECIDELADYAQIKDKIAKITDAAMRGELDFAQSLTERVALLKGLGEDVLQRCYDERVIPMPGAKTLIATLRSAGVHTMLVSGGFTFFTERVARRLGFHGHVANRLDISAGHLTGKVIPPIVTSKTKRETLLELQKRLGLKRGQTLAVGDGANDIPMLREAGLGIAYHAKPKAVEAANIAIRHGDLTSLLFLLGIKRDDFSKANDGA